MAPSHETQLKRMSDCMADLANHGINLADARGVALRRLVRVHLEYFQLMLGYDARPAEIVELVGHTRDRRRAAGWTPAHSGFQIKRTPAQRPPMAGCTNGCEGAGDVCRRAAAAAGARGASGR